MQASIMWHTTINDLPERNCLRDEIGNELEFLILNSGSLIGTTPIQFLRNLHTDFTWPLSVADWLGLVISSTQMFRSVFEVKAGLRQG